jgi:hypothetical protein
MAAQPIPQAITQRTRSSIDTSPCRFRLHGDQLSGAYKCVQIVRFGIPR